MPTAEVLRKRRDSARKREDHVEKLIRGNKRELKELRDAIDQERDERDQLAKRRKEFKDALEEEIKADETGKGEHPDKWEDWVESRRDEFADLIDSCEARINRLLENVADEAKLLGDLRRRDKKLDKRIKMLSRKIERKADAAGQLSADFHMAEFDCNNGTPVPAYMEPSLRALCVQHLQPLRNSGGSVHINSGYRTAAYNAAIGGASQSYHVYTIRKRSPAADHVQSGRSASAVQQWHEAHDRFDGMGFYAGFTHGDDRGYYSRWWGAA